MVYPSPPPHPLLPAPLSLSPSSLPFQDSYFSILHELVVSGEILDLFDKDEMEVILSQLTEDLNAEPDAANWSPEDLKQVFIRVSIRTFHSALLPKLNESIV